MKKLYQDFQKARIVFLASILIGLVVGLTIVGKFSIGQEEIHQLHNINDLLN